jgi:hypothetical protein
VTRSCRSATRTGRGSPGPTDAAATRWMALVVPGAASPTDLGVIAGLARPAGRRQQPQLPGAPHGRGPVTDLELGVDAADVRVDGVRRDGQLQPRSPLNVAQKRLIGGIARSRAVARQARVSAACEIAHKALPRKRRRSDCQPCSRHRVMRVNRELVSGAFSYPGCNERRSG